MLWKNPQAYEPLVRFAFDFARRVTGHDADAEDLAQEALLDLAETEPSHVPERAFVGRKIVLGAKMLRRANLTRARHEQAAARQGVEGHGEEGAEAREALDRLDPEDRHAVELRFLHGLSYAEVAHVLGVSEPAARMRVHRALGSLRERLGPRAEATLAALPLFLAPRSLALQTARAAALVGGGIAMKKIAVMIVVLLALAGGGVVASRAMRATPPQRAESPRALEEVVHPDAAAPVETTSETEGAKAAESPPTPLQTLVGRIAFEDGEPLRRAEITLLGGDTRPYGVTDDEGGFRMRDKIVAGAYLAVVQRKNCYVAIARAELNVVEPLRLDVALVRGTTLEGIVMKAGSPVYNANIYLHRPGAEATGFVQGSFGTCVTDGEGRFLFPFLPDGLYVLSVTRYGIEPGQLEIKVEAGLPPQTITVKDARPLRIRIVPPSRAWRDRRTFRIDSTDPASSVHSIWILAPDDRGEIVVTEAPPPGRYVLCDLPGGYHKFEVTEAGPPEVVIDLTSFGRVVGTVSVPCEVRVGPGAARTDVEGRYEIDPVPPGDAAVSLRLDKAVLHRPPVDVPEAGEVRLDIDLRGVTVRGRLRHDGDPRSGSVALRRAGRGRTAEAWVNEEGRFAIPFVEPGDYEILGHYGGDVQGESRLISVGAQDTDVGEVVVEPGTAVAVIVTAPAGVRLPGSHDMHGWDGREHRYVQLLLDDGGRGVVRLPPGKWRLSLHLGDLPQADVDVDVPTSEPVRFDFTR